MPKHEHEWLQIATTDPSGAVIGTDMQCGICGLLLTRQEWAEHADTAGPAALMPGERCPGDCEACDA